jgi:hypothetical protein
MMSPQAQVDLRAQKKHSHIFMKPLTLCFPSQQKTVSAQSEDALAGAGREQQGISRAGGAKWKFPMPAGIGNMGIGNIQGRGGGGGGRGSAPRISAHGDSRVLHALYNSLLPTALLGSHFWSCACCCRDCRDQAGHLLTQEPRCNGKSRHADNISIPCTRNLRMPQWLSCLTLRF